MAKRNFIGELQNSGHLVEKLQLRTKFQSNVAPTKLNASMVVLLLIVSLNLFPILRAKIILDHHTF